MLLSNGARTIYGSADVLSEYYYDYPELINFDKLERDLRQNISAAEPVKKRIPEHCTEKQRAVYELIGAKPVSYDYLITNSGLEASELSLALIQLELEGLVAQLPGSRYKISD